MSKKEPLMSNNHWLAGQIKKDERTYRVVEKNKVDTENTSSYPLLRVNYDVPIRIRNGRRTNGKITANVLTDRKMKRLGFKEIDNGWLLEKSLKIRNYSLNDSLIVKITGSNNDVDIYVYDNYMEQRYDYQEHLYDDEFAEYPNRIHAEVIKNMRKLVESGVIVGYNEGDFI